MKKCNVCGIIYKFKKEQKITICPYCGSSTLIDYKKRKIFKPFFFSRGRFNPAKAWITIFLLLAFLILVLDMLKLRTFTDTRIIALLGFILGWIGVYTWDRANAKKYRKED
jgi:hypothetical protein